MAHIILKTIKTSPVQAKMPEQISAGTQPMVIDFSKQRTRLISANVLYVLLGVVISFFITSLIALFMLGEQLNHLWRDAQRPASQHVQIASAPVPTAPEQPEVAFPAATITPLPSKAFIIGKDFQKAKSPDKLDLVPMLERLPVGQPNKPSPNAKSYIEVEAPSSMTKAARLQQQADDAIANGETSKAIELYLRAVAISPKDTTLRSNCVALLLEQARAYDEQGDAKPAIAAYKKAERLWQGDAPTAKAIKARIQFLENN